MIDWIVANWEGITIALGAVLALAVAIAKLTPNTTDDAVVGKAKSVFDSIFTKKV
ncbi:MAG: hypothetical protein LRY22_00080 [Aliarcobacter cryaerophilus]|nr:hypothetical protein [Aliarcobacter cryaerophilus]